VKQRKKPVIARRSRYSEAVGSIDCSMQYKHVSVGSQAEEFTTRKSGRCLILWPTRATEPSVQLDLESEIICWLISDSQTYHTAVLDSRWRLFYLVSRIKVQCEFPFKCALEILLLTYLLTHRKWVQSLTNTSVCLAHLFAFIPVN